MSTYYISPSGNNTSGTGGAGSPYRTLDKALSVADAYDTIYVQPGLYPKAVATIGAALSGLTIQGIGDAVLDGANSGSQDGISVNASGVVLRNLTIQNCARDGVLGTDCHALQALGLRLANNGRTGLLTTNAHDVVVSGCVAYGSQDQHGIYLSQSGDRLQVVDNECYGNTKSGIQINALQSGIDSGDAAQDGLSSGCVISGNVLYNNGSDGTAALNLMGVIDSKIWNNLLWGNNGGGMALWDDGFGNSYGSRDNTIYHNTIVFNRGVGKYAVKLTAGASGNTLQNNIFVRPGTSYSCLEYDSTTSGSLTSDYNRFYGETGQVAGGKTLAQWQALLQDTHSSYGDPGLTSTYHLTASSPCRDAGAAGLVSIDRVRTARPQDSGYDLGCYEDRSAAEAGTIVVAAVQEQALPNNNRSTFGYVTFARAYFIDHLPDDDSLPPPPDVEGGGLSGAPSALLLAKIFVTPNSQIENLKRIDTRVRGGGVPVSIAPGDVRLPGETRREIETYWDLGGWDGAPVPLAGALLVDLPEGIRTGASGYLSFTEEEILEIAQRHVAAGVRVLIRYV